MKRIVSRADTHTAKIARWCGKRRSRLCDDQLAVGRGHRTAWRREKLKTAVRQEEINCRTNLSQHPRCGTEDMTYAANLRDATLEELE